MYVDVDGESISAGIRCDETSPVPVASGGRFGVDCLTADNKLKTVDTIFKFDAKEVRRAELLIVLTPQVIRSRYQSEMIKQVESSRMSWCLSDVVDMSGPLGLRSRFDTMGAAEAEGRKVVLAGVDFESEYTLKRWWRVVGRKPAAGL